MIVNTLDEMKSPKVPSITYSTDINFARQYASISLHVTFE